MQADDRQNHFLVMLGSCCDAARLGGATIRLELEDGTVAEGVPTRPVMNEDPADEIDYTGLGHRLQIGDSVVDVKRVRRYTVGRPEPTGPSGEDGAGAGGTQGAGAATGGVPVRPLG